MGEGGDGGAGLGGRRQVELGHKHARFVMVKGGHHLALGPTTMEWP